MSPSKPTYEKDPHHEEGHIEEDQQASQKEEVQALDEEEEEEDDIDDPMSRLANARHQFGDQTPSRVAVDQKHDALSTKEPLARMSFRHPFGDHDNDQPRLINATSHENARTTRDNLFDDHHIDHPKPQKLSLRSHAHAVNAFQRKPSAYSEEREDVDDPASRLANARHQQFGDQTPPPVAIDQFGDQRERHVALYSSEEQPMAARMAPYHLSNDDPQVIRGVARGKSFPTAEKWRAQELHDDHHERESATPVVPIHELGQHKGVNISIEVSDTFVFESPEMMKVAIQGDIGPDDGTYIYSRSCNPTVAHLAKYLAALEGTESANCTSSGMSAITATMIHLCKSGGHVVAAKTLYGGTHFLLKSFLPEKCNIETTFVDITKLRQVDTAIVRGKTNVLYFESIANPAMIVADIPKLCRIARRKGVKVVVDNTFTPMIISPAKHGVDVVIHSLTKYVSGGADIIAGAICGSADLVKEMTSFSGGALMMLGPTMNPKEAFELLERMSHMSLRVKEQCNRALEFARKMKNELLLKVIYPGLDDHPQHQLMDSMKNKGYGFGGVLCLDMGTTKKAFDLVRNLKKYNFGFLAVSLGYYENLISCPGSVSSDVSPGLIRISIGYLGSFDNKWKQFKKAHRDALMK